MFDKQISAADETIISEYTFTALEKRNYSRNEQKRAIQLMDELEKSRYYVDPRFSVDRGEVTGIASYIAYVPSAIGLTVARGLRFPYHIMFLFGRWMNTLFLAIFLQGYNRRERQKCLRQLGQLQPRQGGSN